jgi:folate-binding protein YgfZ
MTEPTVSTSAWIEFLKQQGAQFAAADPLELQDFGALAPKAEEQESFFAPLTDLGLIGAAGDDAASFLHSQLTNDVTHLNTEEARLAGYCSPKGRLLATFLMWRDAQQVFLQLPRALQPAIQKRLQMFVMRAKAKLSDQSDNYAVIGLAGPAALNALAEWFPVLPASPYSRIENTNGTLIRVADAQNGARFQWIATPETLIGAWPKLAQHLAAVGPQAWRLSEIRAGVPQITTATQEQFVPQMINYELIGGVNFKKGCYPGQEIVARSQYLGKLKRRTMLASLDNSEVDVRAGGEIFSSADPEQPCGMVVNAGASGGGRALALVEIKVAAPESGSIHFGSAGGPQLQFHDLPYVLADPQ